MNWFLLLLILKLFTTNWSAPIDLVENKDEVLQDKESLDNLINKGFSVADETNNLIKTSEALVNETVNSFNSSKLNESLNENFNRIKEDLHNFSSAVQKELELEPKESSAEENQAQVTEITSFDVEAPKAEVKVEEAQVIIQTPEENAVGKKEEALGSMNNSSSNTLPVDIESRSNTLISAETEISKQNFNTETSAAETVHTNLNKNYENLQNHFENFFNQEQKEESSNAEISAINQESTNESSTPLSEEKQVPDVQSSSTPEENTSSSEMPALKETVDNLADELLNMASMIQSTTESSSVSEGTIFTKIDVSETDESSRDHEVKTPTFREAVDSFIDDVVEIGSKLGFISEQQAQKPTEIEQVSENIEKVEVPSKSSVSLENSTEQPTQISGNSLDHFFGINQENTKLPAAPISTEEPHLVESSTPYQTESSSETPELKQTIDSFINQVAEIGSSLEETAKEIINNTSMITLNSENSNASETPEVTNENKAESEQKDTQTPEEHSKKVPTFKEAVDAFIEDVVEIGSKLGLVPEEKPTEEHVLVTNKSENKTETIEEVKAKVDVVSINQVSEIGSSLGETAKEIINNTSMITSNSENSNETPEVTVSEQKDTQTPEEHSEKVPTFKEAVDAFIEDVVEIGSKLGLVPEEKPTEEQVSVTNKIGNKTETIEEVKAKVNVVSAKATPENKNVDSISTTEYPANSIIDTFVGKLNEFVDSLNSSKTESQSGEYITTTPPSVEQNNSELTQNTEATNFEKPSETLIQAASEIGNNFGQVVSNLFSLSENKQESSTEVLNESSTKTEEQPNENITTTPAFLEQSNSEFIENTETNNFGRSADTLIQAASEFGNNFGLTVSNLFSLSDNYQESSTEVPSESSTETSTARAENNSENLYMQVSVNDNIQVDTSKTEMKNNETTIQDSNENLQNSTEESIKTFHETENLKLNENLAEQKPKEIKPNPEVQQSTQFVEYIPVSVVTIPEEEIVQKHSVEHVQQENDQLNSENKTTKEQTILDGESKSTNQGEEEHMTTISPIETETKSNVKQMQFEVEAKNTNQEQEEQMTTTSASENETSVYKSLDSAIETLKTEESTTSSSIPQQTTIPAHHVIEETTNALNKFESTLKNLIEQEKSKQQERHLNTLETSQQETTTLTPSSRSFTTAKKESNTSPSQDETTMLPKKFEEELQMAVKALEETTHHHFEEFQNNLKEAFKKFTVWGAEHERQGEATTMKNSQEQNTTNKGNQEETKKEDNTTIKDNQGETTTEIGTTQQAFTEQSTLIPKEEETTLNAYIKENTEQSLVNEEPHRIGAINQEFVDKFADNYEEKSEVSTSEVQKEVEQMSSKRETKEEQITERIIMLTTMSSLEDEDEIRSNQEEQKKEIESSDKVEASTLATLAEENQTPVVENFVKEGTEEVPETTEKVSETTIVPLLARVPLQKDINSISLTTVEEVGTETNTQIPLIQQTQDSSEQFKEAHTELTQTETTQSHEDTQQETITLTSSTEHIPQEMVTFIENNDGTTTVKQEEPHTTQQEVEENTATSRTQEPLTQAAFMEEQQQQIESTTEQEARTQTAAATSGLSESVTTTANMEDDTTNIAQQQQQTLTEEEVNSTTVVENEEENTTNTETSTTTAATVEPEPRSLNLPPPKLEYLQNEDGVEIFYGYSIVKHN